MRYKCLGYWTLLEKIPIYTAAEIAGCNDILLGNIALGEGQRKFKKSNPISIETFALYITIRFLLKLICNLVKTLENLDKQYESMSKKKKRKLRKLQKSKKHPKNHEYMDVVR